MRCLSYICLLTLFTALSFSAADAQSRLHSTMLADGFTPVGLITKFNVPEYLIAQSEVAEKIEAFCDEVRAHYRRYNWKEEPCHDLEWRADLRSTNNHPLIYAVFGSGHHTTLVLGGVHADEITPVPISFRFAKYLKDNPRIFESKDLRVVVAPMVNPDGFLIDRPTRTNANGVDLNRNFFTLDWYDRAILFWTTRQNRRPRYFPGYFPNSEVETMFQIDLIEKFQPAKILSLHSPLGFLDYDGPGSVQSSEPSESERKALKLIEGISRKSKNYRVVNYSFYPGSLGNFAGNERNIPTITLELETTDPTKVDEYWEQFLPGLVYTVQYPFQITPKPGITNASVFFSEYLKPLREDQAL